MAALAAVLSCCCVLPMAAGCGQIACDFDDTLIVAGDPGSPHVNRENYKRVQERMTYEEVAAIFGGPGYFTMGVTLAGHTTKYYEWGGLDGYTVSVCFTDGVVSNKSWWVLGQTESEQPDKVSSREEPEVVERREPPGSSGVAFANFEKIKNGMTYREVVATFGCEGKPSGSRWIGKTELKTYEWRDTRGGYATVDFTRGRACRKYQRGLK